MGIYAALIHLNANDPNPRFIPLKRWSQAQVIKAGQLNCNAPFRIMIGELEGGRVVVWLENFMEIILGRWLKGINRTLR